MSSPAQEKRIRTTIQTSRPITQEVVGSFKHGSQNNWTQHRQQTPSHQPAQQNVQTGPRTINQEQPGSFVQSHTPPDIEYVHHKPAPSDSTYQDPSDPDSSPEIDCTWHRLRETVRDYLRGDLEEIAPSSLLEEDTADLYNTSEDRIEAYTQSARDAKTRINAHINNFLKVLANECQNVQNELYEVIDNTTQNFVADYEQFSKDVSLFSDKSRGVLKDEKSKIVQTITTAVNEGTSVQYTHNVTTTQPRDPTNVEVERATRLCHGIRENAKVEENGRSLAQIYNERDQIFDDERFESILDSILNLAKNAVNCEAKIQSSLNLPSEDSKRVERTELTTVTRVIEPPAEEVNVIEEVSSPLRTSFQRPSPPQFQQHPQAVMFSPIRQNMPGNFYGPVYHSSYQGQSMMFSPVRQQAFPNPQQMRFNHQQQQ